jgi:hypothetical protein
MLRLRNTERAMYVLDKHGTDPWIHGSGGSAATRIRSKDFLIRQRPQIDRQGTGRLSLV